MIPLSFNAAFKPATSTDTKQEIYDECLEIVPDPIRVYQEWVDITDAIHGGENAYSPYEPEEDEVIAAGDIEDEEEWEHSINAKFFDNLD